MRSVTECPSALLIITNNSGLVVPSGSVINVVKQCEIVMHSSPIIKASVSCKWERLRVARKLIDMPCDCSQSWMTVLWKLQRVSTDIVLYWLNVFLFNVLNFVGSTHQQNWLIYIWQVIASDTNLTKQWSSHCWRVLAWLAQVVVQRLYVVISSKITQNIKNVFKFWYSFTPFILCYTC